MHHRSPRRRLAAAVTAVLAVTAGTFATGGTPAVAAAAAAASTSDSVLALAPGASLVSAGAEGFITSVPDHSDGTDTFRWTPYAGGASRDLRIDVIGNRVSVTGDRIAVLSDSASFPVTDMATGTSFTVQKTSGDGVEDFLYLGGAGRAVFTGTHAHGEQQLRMHTKEGESRLVTDVPEGGSVFDKVQPGTSTEALVRYRGPAGRTLGLVDLATATLTPEPHIVPWNSYTLDAAASATYVAWLVAENGTVRAMVRNRETRGTGEVVLGATQTPGQIDISLIGDWLVHGERGRSQPEALRGLTAHNLITGEKIRLLDDLVGSSDAPDGSLLVHGSVSTEPRALHRVSLGANGKPVVTLVARTKNPDAVLHDFNADGTADLLARDASGGLWADGSRDGAPRARIGGGWQIYDRVESVGDVAGSAHADLVARDKAGVLWLYQGANDKYFAAGRYKIGGGWQTYDKITGGGDLTGDGRPDLVAVDKTGGLYLYRATGSATAPFAARKKVGTGWGVYNQLTAAGDIAGGPAGDLVARDSSDTLWLYLGRGDGSYEARKRIGRGWGVYSELVGAGDVDHDGRADFLAYSPSEKTVYLYSGTGNWRAPFKARAKTDMHRDGASYNHVA
ncbi:FG-GAP repeat domain-containing protein [Streptomyces sp. Qhu_M48]|uniref:FG-GAP repeat domain-containing protein n=1 Tax=Streptomyces sp. Qhu_M48 TaxID=3435889 RepID=UPI003F501500